MNQLRFLGTSTSVGVPVIGCDCPTCTSDHPHDQRSRSSVFLEGPFGNILVDSGPDLRQQALREKLNRVDVVLYTHCHLDHVAGFDELRAFCWRREEPLPLYGSEETIQALVNMYPWAFDPEKQSRGYVRPTPRVFDAPFHLNSLTVTPIEVEHGNVTTHGFRFDQEDALSLAYIPDVKLIPESSLALLQDLDILIIDALREEEHYTHMSINEALKAIETLSPKKSYLTHIAHEVDAHALSQQLPQNISLAYDGLCLNLQRTAQS